MAEHTTKRRGVVKGIRDAWDDSDQAEIEMCEPPTAKQLAEHKARMKASKTGKGSPNMVMADAPHGKPEGRRHHISVPKNIGSQFKLGESVEMETTLRHFGKKDDEA